MIDTHKDSLGSSGEEWPTQRHTCRHTGLALLHALGTLVHLRAAFPSHPPISGCLPPASLEGRVDRGPRVGGAVCKPCVPCCRLPGLRSPAGVEAGPPWHLDGADRPWGEFSLPWGTLAVPPALSCSHSWPLGNISLSPPPLPFQGEEPHLWHHCQDSGHVPLLSISGDSKESEQAASLVSWELLL